MYVGIGMCARSLADRETENMCVYTGTVRHR